MATATLKAFILVMFFFKISLKTDLGCGSLFSVSFLNQTFQLTDEYLQLFLQVFKNPGD